MAMVINVLAVKPEIAVVTMKIDARLDHPVHLDPLVPTANTAQKERKAHQDQSVRAKDTPIPPDLPVVKNVRMDPKDPTDPPDPPDPPVPKANPVPKAETENPEAMVLAQPALLAHPEPMVSPVPKEKTVPMPKAEAKALPVVKVKTAAPVPLAAKETTEPQAKPVQPVQPAQPEVLAKEAKMEEKVQLVHPVHPAVPARMPNTVLAPIVRRKHKQQYRINPNTILGQLEFDHDHQFFQHNLKFLVFIIIFIYNWM